MDYEKIEDTIHKALLDNLQNRTIFCQNFTNTRTISWNNSLHAISRADLSCADNYLMKMVATAFNEFERGTIANSKKAFAECGAIIIRCLNYLEEHDFEKVH